MYVYYHYVLYLIRREVINFAPSIYVCMYVLLVFSPFNCILLMMLLSIIGGGGCNNVPTMPFSVGQKCFDVYRSHDHLVKMSLPKNTWVGCIELLCVVVSA